jgi:membrane protease YdiL (CAAX protease family)
MKTIRQFYLTLLAILFAMAVLLHPTGTTSPIWRGALDPRAYEGTMGAYSPEGKLALLGIALMALFARLIHRERWELGSEHPLSPHSPVAASLGYDAVLATIGVLALGLLTALVPRTEPRLELPNVFYLVFVTLLVGIVEIVGTIRAIPPRSGGEGAAAAHATSTQGRRDPAR